MQTKLHHTKNVFHENRFYYLSLVAAAAILLILLLWPHTAKSEKTFAMCLAEKGVTMYGSDFCDLCKEQKYKFGQDFQNIKYINCDVYPDICSSRNIISYPVWNLGDKYIKGVKTLPQLSQWSNCPLIPLINQ